jgi:hypothetical protein
MTDAATARNRTFLWLLAGPLLFAAGAFLAMFVRPPVVTLPPASTTVTEVRKAPSVLVAVRDLARLETAEFHMERVVDLREKQTHLFGLVQAEDALLLVAAGEVVAGIDLGALRPEDVIVDTAKGQASLVLPRPTVFTTHLDAKRTYVHSRKTDLFAKRAEALEGKAREEAERTLRLGAEEAGLLERARVNAERTVTSLVKSLGYAEVNVRFRDVPSTATATPATTPAQ